MEIMKTQIMTGETMSSKIAEKLKIRIETRFMCTPGIRPVKIPEATPRVIARIISRNI